MQVKVAKSRKAARAPAGPEPLSLGIADSLVALRREIDTLVDSFYKASPYGSGRWNLSPFRHLERAIAPTCPLTPKVKVGETDTEFTVSAELPGMDEDDIEVILADGTLTVKGEKRTERQEARRNSLIAERSYGSFRRSFPVPERVDADRITAFFDQGVLHMTLPKRCSKRPKRVEIKGG
ncbi:MAG: Hsp20/alpha crystallin family protein [Magnetospirillum sp. WYHS-4]